SADKINIYKKFQRNDTCFKMINSDISYLLPGTIKNAYLPEIMPEILKTKGLIIDLRCYPSEFIVFTLSEYLQQDAAAFVNFTKGNILTPGLFTKTDNLVVGRKNENAYKGKVVILVNEVTQSQAEYTSMAFRTVPNSVVIGSTTAGADGNVSEVVLPGGMKSWISGIGVYYPDGKETQRIGIVPDIEVRPTIEGITKGRDEVLEKAIEIIDGK
ncbi:MAG: S41 family peptidase, partial [Ignavibacteria bacterium]